MKDKNFLQKSMLYAAVCSLLLAFCLLSGILPGLRVSAAERVRSVAANPQYTLTSTEGDRIATTADPNKTTVLIFGYTGCSKTRSTLNSVSSSGWVKRSDIRVIFAETSGKSQEDVSNYKAGYQCEEMIFCYDEDDTNFMVMAAYAKLFGMNGGSYPMIVLIDKNNQIQNILSGTTTADEILTEIKKFENIDDSGSNTPPSDSGIENLAYGLTTIDNTTVSTKANPNETTVLIFGYLTCGNTKATLQSIDKSSWVGRSDIRVIFADAYGNTLADTKEFAQNYTSGKMIFCHDEANLNWNLALTYLSYYNLTGGTFPYIVLIDQNNKIRSLTLGTKTADEIIAEIEKFTAKEPETPPGDTSGKPEGPSAGDDGTGNSTDGPAPVVSNITGLKAVSSAKKIKLSWKKVPAASGYIVYQYNSSKKAWTKKATVNTNTASYTVKGLASGTAYRFAVKAFINQNKNQITSQSYTSVDTATTPAAVSFKVTSGKKKATVKWKKVKGATGYTVCYKTKAKGSWKKLKTTKGASFTKKKLKSGKTYYFTVKAYKTYKKKTYTSSFSGKKVVIK
ncbi:MAG: hypothetical protein HFJ04_02230 [Lachnospiraceae bacterium]|nr:hypothetical protein [Lachnospiraceae bacterium]